jgi:hypothetical protein
MIDLLLFPVVVVVLLLLLATARRVERALWAVVSQLQAERRENRLAMFGSEGEVPLNGPPAHRHVVNSMFGR